MHLPPPPPLCVCGGAYVGQKTASVLSDVAQELSALLFETRSLKDLELNDEARPGWPASPRDPPSPPSLGLQEHVPRLAFYADVGDQTQILMLAWLTLTDCSMSPAQILLRCTLIGSQYAKQ